MSVMMKSATLIMTTPFPALSLRNCIGDHIVMTTADLVPAHVLYMGGDLRSECLPEHAEIVRMGEILHEKRDPGTPTPVWP
jgi:hypothetical protein